jgi:hypothetical protein
VLNLALWGCRAGAGADGDALDRPAVRRLMAQSIKQARAQGLPVANAAGHHAQYQFWAVWKRLWSNCKVELTLAHAHPETAVIYLKDRQNSIRFKHAQTTYRPAQSFWLTRTAPDYDRPRW